MASSRILVVEDDQTLLDVLKYNLNKEGYTISVAIDGVQGLEIALAEKPDLIVLDLMLPKMDGLEVCRVLRRETTVPILMLTAKSEEIDKVVGLEIGADDYITKPFSMRELLARIRAMLRRAEMLRKETALPDQDPSTIIKAGDIEIDLVRYRVSKAGSSVDVTPKEFELLACLMKYTGRVCSRDHLLQEIWGYDFEGDTRTVDVHIRWLRQKIEVDPANPRHLITVRGFGYKFEE
ncbi:MAG: response regulator transcription factor [Chloroflexota bacterium]|nr:response regulator transcription factor [Chloroflexota bacterium]